MNIEKEQIKEIQIIWSAHTLICLDRSFYQMHLNLINILSHYLERERERESSKKKKKRVKRE